MVRDEEDGNEIGLCERGCGEECMVIDGYITPRCEAHTRRVKTAKELENVSQRENEQAKKNAEDLRKIKLRQKHLNDAEAVALIERSCPIAATEEIVKGPKAKTQKAKRTNKALAKLKTPAKRKMPAKQNASARSVLPSRPATPSKPLKQGATTVERSIVATRSRRPVYQLDQESSSEEEEEEEEEEKENNEDEDGEDEDGEE